MKWFSSPQYVAKIVTPCRVCGNDKTVMVGNFDDMVACGKCGTMYYTRVKEPFATLEAK